MTNQDKQPLLAREAEQSTESDLTIPLEQSDQLDKSRSDVTQTIPTELEAMLTTGLTSQQVQQRIARGETNDFQVQVGRSYWEIFRDNVLTVFNTILAILLVILMVRGDWISVLFAGFSVVLNSIIGVVQEINAKHALEKLAAMSIQEVQVLRDGQPVKLPITQLVKDDILPLGPGDRMAVDGILLKADALEVDESLLTGESDAILKDKGDPLTSGSFCIAGSGVMAATQVGANSTINKLSQTAKAYRRVTTPTQRQINTIVKLSIMGMLIFGPMTVLSGLARHFTLDEIARNTVVLVTSFVPQGLVLATTVSLTLGALAISRKQTLVQRVNAVESLANVNVLCFDKTGTLTRNQLQVTQIIPLGQATEEDIRGLLRTYTTNLSNLNKTAHAIAECCGGTANTEKNKLNEIPFNSARKWGAVVFPTHTFILGAPERVLRKDQTAVAIQQAHDLAAQGQRVLAFARTETAPTQDHLSADRQPLALIVMSDQVRDDIADTLEAFRRQHVALKVISGDNAETVSAIAAASGMQVTKAMTGEEVEALSPADLSAAVRDANVFARIEPETKRKIIRSLRQQGAYVAMVGDGVNDVPALKEANMAIAMNDGAQIAKDVADVVLLNNAMSTLPLAFEEGKIITQKILASARLFLSKNFYTILAFLFIGYMTLPFPTNPIQISWLTFGVVNAPALLITFGWLRARRMHNFDHDVLRYVVAAVLIGALIFTILYLALVVSSAGTIQILSMSSQAYISIQSQVRVGALIFMILYGVLIFWNTFEVDVLRPRTFLTHWKTALVGVILGIVSIIVPYAWPQIFDFRAPTLFQWVLILAAWGVSIVALRYVYYNDVLIQLMDGEDA